MNQYISRKHDNNYYNSPYLLGLKNGIMSDFEKMIMETFWKLDIKPEHFSFALSHLSDKIDEHNKENGFEDDRELLEWDRLAANARILSTQLAKILLSIKNRKA